MELGSAIKNLAKRLKAYRDIIGFREDFYLVKHPDVAAAVKSGLYTSGLDHFLRHGWKEWRETKPPSIKAGSRDAFAQTEFASLKTIERRIQPLAFHLNKTARRTANVFIPALDNELIFGGYIAFLNFLMRLSRSGMAIQFIVMEQADLSQATFAAFTKQERWEGAFDSAIMLNATHRDIIVEIGPEDQFYAYSCWTALDAAPLAAACGRKLVFFIQEYEPTFHAYDSFHFVADSAYRLPHVAIFNSRALCEYFRKHGIGVFSHSNPEYLVFEHAITVLPKRTGAREGGPALLFYARPEAHAARNLFAVGVMALRECARRGIITPSWSLTGIGATTHYTIDIAPEIKLYGLPKAPLAQYQGMIANYSLGLSLMAAPHPGVVHFEWAASGLRTVVNTTPERPAEFFAGFSPNLIPAEPSVGGIADAIALAEQPQPCAGPTEFDSIPHPRSWSDAFDGVFFGSCSKCYDCELSSRKG